MVTQMINFNIEGGTGEIALVAGKICQGNLLVKHRGTKYSQFHWKISGIKLEPQLFQPRQPEI